jgi:alpha-beta hydrolase superfamily lysophospholipase
MPPTLLFPGTADTTTPYKGAQLFDAEMRKAGKRMELVTQPEARHTYMFKDATLFAETLKKLDAFLLSLDLVSIDSPKNSIP